VHEFVRTYQVAGHAASASTAAIALKALARYLAQHKVWYGPGFSSVLAGLEVPQPNPRGRKTFSDDELRTIHQLAAQGPNPLLHEAVLYLIRHGLRPDEVRVMLRESVVIPIRSGERGSIHVKGAKTPSGIREIPLEPRARNFLIRYVRDGRAEFRGCRRASCPEHPDGAMTPEPFFTTADGQPFHESGWKSLLRRFSARARAAGIAGFCVYRLRGTRARELKEAGWGDSEVIQVLGWSPKNGQRMLRRYIGEYSPKHLKSLPTTFERIA
jgi:integrase